MARVAKTLAEHQRDRTFRADRHAGMQPGVEFEAGGVGEMPEDLSGEAAIYWLHLCEVVPSEVQSMADRTSFEIMARYYAEMQKCFRAAAELDAPANIKCLRMGIDTEKRLMAYLMQYGLTAASRPKIKAPVKVEEDDDPLARLHEESREAG